MHSHPKRDEDGYSTLDLSNFPEQGRPGYIDEEEAALPEISYHDAYGKLISWEDVNRLAAEEVDREANDTLHVMYPDQYPCTTRASVPLSSLRDPHQML
ncbi:hypothetical protein DOTSEDRAFT_27020 [Dothistroma septosporum NZE10]|uniref:Uncharacterized protein n=1 Tax=Dothistroma septosporum (strain NZE10 / CBS 128990) TaxID=675120 RepID=N1PHQ8_DOTSN|nr:hypothetical protein DOTSEDRAFT_27020 [Dothistroma septosporum NZE10]